MIFGLVRSHFKALLALVIAKILREPPLLLLTQATRISHLDRGN